ncbi:DUF4019 domain-containing protein [Cocleimonas sp. KMM 6892]|uniref:DUF4019 domain-containing protein n=1 Tax=unclassified Cocleimonas TaxID=2639732 RepID=UPI002DBD899A|nr:MULTISPECIES: DUF4019 domain-containing protein [unclassified Cocleimonas]MEB8434300.1 DUF4019 domain-containing protein [Cocleimonas sp. KMM 6892]MEC4717081.1 DUF4019 domain-containing protein [Cocleimonas sp. KMM 6895]MEC4746572.1 DUF4019 domain-containing protein [Cocleimonas sp. KMM 6896]
MIFKNVNFLLSVFLLFFSSVIYAEKFDDVGESNKWLHLIDSGKYSESWSETDPFFKQQITQEKWTKVINNVRTPLGNIISRKKINSKEYTSLPGAPDGKYIVLQFKTAFQNKKDSTETLTFSYSNERWSVVGYFIK